MYAEITMIFRKPWLGVGRASIVSAPGDYITLDIAGQNIILLRDKEGVLQAYANTCSHRGARLLDGEGSCKSLRCPFHSWLYNINGKLISAPHMEQAQGFDKSEHGLISYRVEERLGFVFLCLDENTKSLDEYLGDFPAIHAPWPMENLVVVRRQEMEVDCNWKLSLEVFNEYYTICPLYIRIPLIIFIALPSMNCSDARQGRFQPNLEPNVANFARWYADHWF